MKISTKGRYSIRIMIDLALNGSGEYIALKDVSKRQNITVKYLEQIIPVLIKAGYVKSLRGKSGGYKLARPANEYTIGEILRTAEGNLAPVTCLEDDVNQCPMSQSCYTLPFWKGLDLVINNYVDSFTLEDLITNNNEAGGDNYYI